MSTAEKPVLAGITGDDYLAALTEFVAVCDRFITHENPDYADAREMEAAARSVSKALRDDGYRPRQKMTRADVYRNTLRRLANAVQEYTDLADYEYGALGLNVWDAFESIVKSTRRSVEHDEESASYWAPEDDTNPIKVVPIPEPDTTQAVANGIMQGDWIKANYEDKPRRILTGPDDRGLVRVSDPRDGAGNFGGYCIAVKDLGRYQRVEAP